MVTNNTVAETPDAASRWWQTPTIKGAAGVNERMELPDGRRMAMEKNVVTEIPDAVYWQW